MNNLIEDIMIVEELLQGAKDNGMYDNNKYSYSIANLIKGYRELEEKQKSYDISYNLGKAFANKQWETKVKEKIEELRKSPTFMDDDYLIKDKQIQVLQELMEDK